jgi:uncharacterized membrane protein YczE
MYGIFTDEEWKRHKKKIIVIMVGSFLIGVGTAIHLSYFHP